MKKFLIVLISILILAGLGLGGYYFLNKKPNTPNTPNKPNKPTPNNETDFNLGLIKTVNSSYNSNYLISPYSIEIALRMLKEGATGNTLTEIEKVVGNRTINPVSDDVKVANAMFIKNEYKKDIKDEYYSLIKTNYNADMIYDDFATPDVINDWVNQKTDGMIPSILDDISSDFVLGLANALAIDVKWQSQFECEMTRSQEFTKLDGTKYNVEMMHQLYESGVAKYFVNDDAKGVVLPYASTSDSRLEFVGILPKNDVSLYIESLTGDKLKAIDESAKPASKSTNLYVSLPRFKYDFNLDTFTEVLQTMGINDAFSEYAASFKNISEKVNVFVGTAIHKTHIELSESGTKAAAVTFFGMEKSMAALDEDEQETIYISFDKPFVYMIRDTKTKEVLFFGVTYEPNEWKGSTCVEQ